MVRGWSTMGVNEVDYKKIGQRIRTARKKLGLTQEELADDAGMNASHLSHIETGQTKLSLPTIVVIANSLSISVDELLCGNLKQFNHVYYNLIVEELSDCDEDEMQAILEIVHSSKTAIKKARKVQNTFEN